MQEHALTRICVCWSIVLLLSSCRKPAPAAQALPVEKIPEVVATAFKESPGQTKEIANEVVVAMQNEDPPRALHELDSLHSRPDLSTEQRRTISQARQALLERLRAAATKGDKSAEAALEQHRATK